MKNKNNLEVGRPEFKPTLATREQVEKLSGFGLTQDQIASVLKVSRKTLAKHFSMELQLGKAKANLAVAQNLFDIAINDRNVTASIFWLKTQAGWTEKDKIEHSIDASNIQLVSKPPALTREEWLKTYSLNFKKED